AQSVGRGQDDALVRLMRDEAIEIRPGDAIACENGFRCLSHLAHSKLVHRLAVLVDYMHVFRESLRAGRIKAAATGHVEGGGARSIDLMIVVDESNLAFQARL